MTDHERAKREYLGGKSLKDIAADLGIKDSTIRSWKLRDNWPNVQRKRATRKKRIATQKKGKREPVEIGEPLNEKQQIFCEIYVKEFNATQAYLKVYNCEYSTAAVNGCRLLQNANVRAYIEYLKKIKKQTIMMDVDDVVEKMMRIAFADIGDYVTFGRREVPVMGPFGPIVIKDEKTGAKIGLKKTVNYIDVRESWVTDTSLLAEISQGRDGIKVKMLDQMKALEWLGRYYNAFPMDKHRIEYDQKKQDLDRLEYERKKKKDEDW